MCNSLYTIFNNNALEEIFENKQKEEEVENKSSKSVLQIKKFPKARKFSVWEETETDHPIHVRTMHVSIHPSHPYSFFNDLNISRAY